MDTVQTDESNETGAQPTEEDTTQQTTAAETAEQETAVEETAADQASGIPVTFTSEQILAAETSEEASYLDLDGAADPTISTSVFPGVASIVAAGLGLASITGTWLGTMISDRLAVIGQIKVQAGATTDPIAAVYGVPWHATALVNGALALITILIAGVVLLRERVLSPIATPWVRAVAGAALVLGVIGLLIAAAMYSDLFTAMPSIPGPPPAGAAG